MRRAKTFAPCHITGMFQIFDESPDPLRRGSRGAGVCLAEGITTTAEIEDTSEKGLEIFVNGYSSSSAITSERVVDVIRERFPAMRNLHIRIQHQETLPIGSGFGTSGAGALSLALALNEAGDLALSKIEAAQIAHEAEVDCRTGLGTVIAEIYGGVEIRLQPGAPGIGQIERIHAPKDLIVACLTMGPLSTSELLTDQSVRRRINESGRKLINRLDTNPDFENFMKLSRIFAEHVGLITARVRKVLEATDRIGVACSMPMFGESVFTLIKRDDLESILATFKEHQDQGKIVVSDVDQQGAKVIS